MFIEDIDKAAELTSDETKRYLIRSLKNIFILIQNYDENDLKYKHTINAYKAGLSMHNKSLDELNITELSLLICMVTGALI